MSSAAIEVPCFFLLCVLVWKLGGLAIATWSKVEAERTRVMASGDDERTKAIAKGFADITAELKSVDRRVLRIEEHLEIEVSIDAPTQQTDAA